MPIKDIGTMNQNRNDQMKILDRESLSRTLDTMHQQQKVWVGGGTMNKVWYEPKQCYISIRRLTPKECFRLQGWTDDYFERAAFVNFDSQLYKQAGNGVTVLVIQAIAERM